MADQASSNNIGALGRQGGGVLTSEPTAARGESIAPRAANSKTGKHNRGHFRARLNGRTRVTQERDIARKPQFATGEVRSAADLYVVPGWSPARRSLAMLYLTRTATVLDFGLQSPQRQTCRTARRSDRAEG